MTHNPLGHPALFSVIVLSQLVNGLWLLGLFSCWPHNLELSPRFYAWPNHQCRLFQTPA